MTYTPLVSIIIPVYNGSNFLGQAIESALNQSYKNIEVIVVNDGSCDDNATSDIAKAYGDKIKYYEKENGGVSSALNFGMSKMTGSWFSWLSHDDLYCVDKIQNQILRINSYIDTNSHFLDNIVILCDTEFINDKNDKLFRIQFKPKKTIYIGVEMLIEVFNGYNINGCSLLINKKIFDQVGNFKQELKYMQDLEMWYRMMFSNNIFLYINNKDVLSRVHSKQTTVTSKHLGPVDTLKVGHWLVQQLSHTYVRNVSLLVRYYYLSCKRNDPTVRIIREEMKKNEQYSTFVRIKGNIFLLYGWIRPLLVKMYYRIVFNKNN